MSVHRVQPLSGSVLAVLALAALTGLSSPAQADGEEWTETLKAKWETWLGLWWESEEKAREYPSRVDLHAAARARDAVVVAHESRLEVRSQVYRWNNKTVYWAREIVTVVFRKKEGDEPEEEEDDDEGDAEQQESGARSPRQMLSDFRKALARAKSEIRSVLDVVSGVAIDAMIHALPPSVRSAANLLARAAGLRKRMRDAEKRVQAVAAKLRTLQALGRDDLGARIDDLTAELESAVAEAQSARDEYERLREEVRALSEEHAPRDEQDPEPNPFLEEEDEGREENPFVRAERLERARREGGTIDGIVEDAVTGRGLAGVEVVVRDGRDRLGRTATDADGRYRLRLPAGAHVVRLTRTGYLPVATRVEVRRGEETSVIRLRQVDAQHAGTGVVLGEIKNAFDGEPVDGARITFRSSANPDAGAVAGRVTTDVRGRYRISLPAGNYTGVVAKAEFTDARLQVVAIGGVERDDQNASLAPRMRPGTLRIVLTWGSSPKDLDSHLKTPGGSHIYYHSKGSERTSPYCRLDVDDTTSFGPETISVYRSRPGTYRYSVHKYSGDGSLGSSRARVEVYGEGGHLRTYHVPSAGSGRYWHVFEYDGSSGRIRTVNRIGGERGN